MYKRNNHAAGMVISFYNTPQLKTRAIYFNYILLIAPLPLLEVLMLLGLPA